MTPDSFIGDVAGARTALVTGAGGFVGKWLCNHLTDHGFKVVGTSLGGNDGFVALDVTDSKAVAKLVGDTRPDEIYHLAGLTRPAMDDLSGFWSVNLDGARNVLEAVANHHESARVLVVGSAYAYGRHEGPIAETDEMRPLNHYGASKACADLLAQMYADRGLHVVRVRPFNHSGPGQHPDFVLPTLVEQFAAAQSGNTEPVIKVGNLTSVRDFSDVRDIVRGYRMALHSANPGSVYNMGSGRGVSVEELISTISRVAGITPQVEVEGARVRVDDLPVLIGDVAAARRDFGWYAAISLEQTIADMLEHSANRVAAV